MKTLLAILTMTFVLFAVPTFAVNPGGSLVTKECTYDFSKNGGAVGFIAICGNQPVPVGAIVVDMHYLVQTAFTSGGSATVALGDAASGARYLAATAFDNAAYTVNTVAKAAIGTPMNLDSANEGKMGITVAVAALTGGKLKMIMTFYVPKQ